MIYIKNKQLVLRTITLEDLDFLAKVENDATYFHLSASYGPYSREELIAYIKTADIPIEVAKQYRFVICLPDESPIGFVDLFAYDDVEKTLGIGIIIYEEEYRNKGFAQGAISLLLDYCFDCLQIKCVNASVLADNKNSLLLFTRLGFQKTGTSSQWNPYLKQNKDMVYFVFDKLNE